MLQNTYGKNLYYATAGSIGYKGKQKSTLIACSKLLVEIQAKFQKYSFSKINIYFKGTFKWRRRLLKVLIQNNLKLKLLTEITKLPHNGCKLPKKKRY
jgi:small subunit ribosomal protein S11